MPATASRDSVATRDAPAARGGSKERSLFRNRATLKPEDNRESWVASPFSGPCVHLNLLCPFVEGYRHEIGLSADFWAVKADDSGGSAGSPTECSTAFRDSKSASARFAWSATAGDG